MKKGFTLIELLAVIVILAIIALIATPMVLNIINDSKDESNKRSIEMYAKAIENAIASNQLTSTEAILGGFDYEENGHLLIQGERESITIEYDGNVVCETIQIYEDGKIYLADCKVDEKQADYAYGTKQSYNDGTEIYFDIKTGKSCINYHEDNSKTGYNGLESTKTTDNQNSCLKFYTFLHDGGKTVNLLLDHNTTATLAWTNSEKSSNSNGPIDVINQLKIDTNEWNGTITPLNYEYKSDTKSYTIDYSEYKARLITADEVAKITGADKVLNWSETLNTSSTYYFDGKKGTDSKWQTQIANSSNPSNYYWLFDRTKNCTTYGCKKTDGSTFGYWTSSPSTYTSHAWAVRQQGYITGNSVKSVDLNGVRPVITVLKNDIEK